MTAFPTGHTGEAARYRRSGARNGRLLDGYVDAAPPDRVVVVDGAVRLTYAELRDRVARAAAGITAFLDGQGIAKQKYPEHLLLVDELPKTPTGKVQKFRLRALAADRADHVVTVQRS